MNSLVRSSDVNHAGRPALQTLQVLPKRSGLVPQPYPVLNRLMGTPNGLHRQTAAPHESDRSRRPAHASRRAPEQVHGCSCPSNPLSPRLAPAGPCIPLRQLGCRQHPPDQAGARTPWLLSTWSHLAAEPCAQPRVLPLLGLLDASNEQPQCLWSAKNASHACHPGAAERNTLRSTFSVLASSVCPWHQYCESSATENCERVVKPSRHPVSD